MAFRPNMTAVLDGIRPVAALRWRAWSGAVADLWEAAGEPGGGGHYVSPDPRLVVFLGEGPSPVGLSDRPGGPAAGKVAFIPAGQPIWSRVAADRPFRHLDLHLANAPLRERLEGRAALDRPVLLDAHPGVERLAALLAREVAGPGGDDLVAEGLATAMLGLILRPAPTRPRPAGGLSPAQIRRVTDLMRAGMHRRLSVAELAAAAGLSESWFAHAFRRSVGASPARHLTRLRIEAAQAMLRTAATPIGEIAAATGFADQAHLTRAFREATGTTPAAWRRAALD
ncbi:helix-turn-helix domain-containing protein [Rubellimicrobium aerolatum]|uniref:Helix-turn-helix domain-containing protein n=1 Tax=Rubellimicrobium aerolatum TaxID=490979 RepID=A0ABW0SEB0_9RHOB|nr:AraC family transcriptional regulator [Rubellimicrobium aerolatum]MBP1806870.1 AraC-like DNA-binding protein [Rubellimicrobium aerolatum]